MNWHEQARLFRKALKYGQEMGPLALARSVLHKARQRYTAALAKKDVLAEYAFIQKKSIGAAPVAGQVSDKTMNWVVPPFGRGAGGHLNIFRYIYHLEKMGFDCRVIVEGEPKPVSAEQAKQEIRKWFFPIEAEVYVGLETAPPAYVTLATNWQTSYAVRNFQSTLHYVYFVQDFEPFFHPTGSEYALAEATYKFGFTGITAGQWLADKLAEDYGMTTHAVGFSYDTDLYRPLPKRESKRQVFFYARPSTARRGFELGLMVLAEVTRRLPDVQVVLAGGNLSSYEIPFPHIDVGTLSITELPDLYSQCDAALVLSFSNLSLLPLELMACSVPVISNRAPYTTWLLNDSNAKLAEPTPEELANAVCEVLENQQERERLKAASLATAHTTSWQAEAEKVAAVVSQLGQAQVRL